MRARSEFAAIIDVSPARNWLRTGVALVGRQARSIYPDARYAQPGLAEVLPGRAGAGTGHGRLPQHALCHALAAGQGVAVSRGKCRWRLVLLLHARLAAADLTCAHAKQGVSGVFFSQEYVTVSKKSDSQWADVKVTRVLLVHTVPFRSFAHAHCAAGVVRDDDGLLCIGACHYRRIAGPPGHAHHRRGRRGTQSESTEGHEED